MILILSDKPVPFDAGIRTIFLFLVYDSDSFFWYDKSKISRIQCVRGYLAQFRPLFHSDTSSENPFLGFLLDFLKTKT